MTLSVTNLGESLEEAEVVAEIEGVGTIAAEVTAGTWVVDITGDMEAVGMVLTWETHTVSPLSSLPA